MRAFTAEDLSTLHDRLCHTIVHADKDQLDVITSVDVQIHNVIAEARSMSWDFDLKSMWLTKSRWSMMARQYIDVDELIAWLAKCSDKIGLDGRGIAALRTKEVKARGGPAQGNKETRRWGSCMLALTYKAQPRPQITLYSRTSYLGYLAALDLSVAWMCARYLAKELNCAVEDFAFVWMNEAMQYHNFKSMAYLLNHPIEPVREMYRGLLLVEEDELSNAQLMMVAHSPALRLTRKWMNNMLRLDAEEKTLGDMSYNTYRRIRRRYHTEVLGYDRAKEFEGWSYHKKGPKEGKKKEHFKAYQPLPHVLISDCDFSPIGLPLGMSDGD